MKEKKGVNILDNALNWESDLILIDELGVFKNDSEYFKNSVIDSLESKTKVIGVLKKKDTEFLNSIKHRTDILLIKVDKENRDNIEEEIKNYWNL